MPFDRNQPIGPDGKWIKKSAVVVRTASGRNAAKKGDRAEAWRRMALKEINKNIKHDLRCAVQSHGQVQQFFLKHPRDKLDQLLFVVSDTNGDLIVGSVTWVKMPSTASAQQLKKLEDTYGTG